MPDQLESIVQRMIDAGESEENIATVIRASTQTGGPKPITDVETGVGHPLDPYIRGFGEGAVKGITGFAKGVADKALHPIDTATGIIGGTLGAAKDALIGAGRLVTDPQDVLPEAGHAVANMPANTYNAVGDWLNKAGADPEAAGQDIGHATADTMAGVAMGGGLRYAPRPVARQVGGLVEAIGDKGKWPIRMMGAHQLGSGNPMGLVTIGLPDMLKAGGKKVAAWGRAEPALLDTEAQKFMGPPGPSITPAIPAPSPLAEDPVDFMLRNRKPEEGLAPDQIKARRLAAKDAENAAKLAQVESDKAGLQATPPKVSQSVSAVDESGRRVSSRRAFTPPPEDTAVAADPLADIKAGLKKSGYAPSDPDELQALAEKVAGGTKVAQPVQPAAPARPVVRIAPESQARINQQPISQSPADAAWRQEMTDRINAENARQAAEEATKAAGKASGRKAAAAPTAAVETPQPTPTPVAAPAAAPVAAAPQGMSKAALFQDKANKIATGQPPVDMPVAANPVPSPEPTATPVPEPAAVPEPAKTAVRIAKEKAIPLTKDMYTKSRREMSATPGFTVADMNHAGLDATKVYTKLPPSKIQMIFDGRAARRPGYRTAAGLEKGFKRGVASEE